MAPRAAATRWWPAAIRAARALGEAVREILLDRHDLHIHRRSEMLLYMAARAQLVEEVIRPALDTGKIVVDGPLPARQRGLPGLRRRPGRGNALDHRAAWPPADSCPI